MIIQPLDHILQTDKLNTTCDEIDQCNNALMFIMSEIIRKEIEGDDLNLLLSEVGFNADVIDVFIELIEEHREKVQKIIDDVDNGPITYPRYRDIEWRLQIQTDSRGCYQQSLPEIVMQVKTEFCESQFTIKESLVSDVENVRHLVDELQNALETLKSRPAKRLMHALDQQ